MKMTKWVFLPLGLLFAGILLSIVYFINSDINPNILPFNHSASDIKNINGVISGEFKAQENYLGLVSMRFNNKKTLEGESLFRIKNVLDKDWYHEATIAAAQYNTPQLYAFGLPTIAKSKNKTYQFELRLLDTNTASPSLALSHEYPVLLSQYAFPKNILIEDKFLLVNFIYKKLAYNAKDPNSSGVLLVYSIPLILYFFYLVFERQCKSWKITQIIGVKLLPLFKPYIVFIFLGIFIDVYITREYTDSTTSFYVLLWILAVAAYRLESRYSFGIALILLIVCPFFLTAKMGWIAEKNAIWAYMFLVVGTIHSILELKMSESPKMNDFFSRVNIAPSFIMQGNSFISRCIKNGEIIVLLLIRLVIKITTTLIYYLDSFIINFTKYVVKFALFSVRNFVKVVIVFIITSIMFLIGFDLYLKAMTYRDRQMKNPGNPIIEPTLVYPGTKIIIYGERFGDNSNGKYALMKDGIRVRPDYWEDHKIIFTVPLEWKQPGNMQIWIEKPIEWNAETIIEKTKPITIKLLKVTGQFTPDDDLYFEQIKTWRKETKEINGYK